jgi:hypothetical protein
MPTTPCAQDKDMAVERDGGGVVMWRGNAAVGVARYWVVDELDQLGSYRR